MDVTASQARASLIELAKKARLADWQRNPEKWYVERFGGKLSDIKWSEWPGYENHQWDGTPDPFLTAIKALARARNAGIESATGTGKTFIASKIIYWFLDVFPDALVITTAPKERQLKSILWREIEASFPKFKRLRPGAEIFNLRIVPDASKLNGVKLNYDPLDDDDNVKKISQCLGVVAGVRAGEESATKMQGFHAKYMLFILEEAAGIPHPVMTAVKQTVTGDFNPILAIGNPDNVTDALHQFCEGQNVEHIRISAYDHPNIVCGHTVIDGAVSKKSINIRLAEYGSESNLFRSRVRGIAPEQATDALILLKWVYQCAVNHETYAGVDDDPFSLPAMGIDVANSERGDLACLCSGKGNECNYLYEFNCRNATQLAYNVFMSDEKLLEKGFDNYGTRKIQDWKISGDHIGIDAVGIGVATVNAFLEHGYPVKPLQGGSDEEALPKDNEGKPLYKFRTLRAQMWYQARLDLQNKKCRLNISLPDLYKLGKELTMPRYTVSDGAIVLEKKEEIKKRLGKSPNRADAFVYWNWMRRVRSAHYGGEMPVGDMPKQEFKDDDFEIDDYVFGQPQIEPGEFRPPTDPYAR